MAQLGNKLYKKGISERVNNMAMFHHFILISSGGHNSFMLPPLNFQKIALSKSFPMSYRKSLRGVHIRS